MTIEEIKLGQHIKANCGCTGYITAIHHETGFIDIRLTRNCSDLYTKNGSIWYTLPDHVVEETPEPEDPVLRAFNINQPLQKELFP